jgi:ketosteroid isomerase-like protein
LPSRGLEKNEYHEGWIASVEIFGSAGGALGACVNPLGAALIEVRSEDGEVLVRATASSTDDAELRHYDSPRAADEDEDARSRVPSPDRVGRAAQVVREWASAWSRRDSEAYLTFYSVSFVPPQERPLEEWKEERRQRLSAEEDISVDVSDLQVSERTDGDLEARFQQRYESKSFSDVVLKTLLLRKEGETWRIVAESSSPLG